MTSAASSLTFVQGEGGSILVKAVALGDVTGWSAHTQIRPRVGGPVLLDLVQDAGITVLGPQSGFQLVITGAQMTALGGGAQTTRQLFWDLFVAAPGGSGSPLALVPLSTFYLAPAVTVPAL